MIRIIISKANVEWHKDNASKSKEVQEYISLIAALLSIIASLLTIFCR